MRHAPEIVLSENDRNSLQSWSRSRTIEKRASERATIILKAASGMTNKEIAAEMKIREASVSMWRSRFVQLGLSGLDDKHRSGKPPVYGEDIEERVLSVLDKNPPKGFGKWNGPLIAEILGDVSEHKVWRVLKKHGISLERKHSWCVSTDPEFAAKAADIVGIYLNPPENGIVICVDEKPAIQALARAQGWLQLPNGKAITGFNHEYKRNGTTTLFAALEITTGLVKANHYKRRRRVEFLDFMNRVIEDYPKQQLHVVLDNLSTHKPKRDMWLARHKNVTFHYTPTHASWLNQVEVWFSILQKKSLSGTSFNSIQELRDHITAFIEAYNENAEPFQWTKNVVYKKELKAKVKKI